ncbi:alpha/beta fold hydrolase [Hoeflea sp. TYP-13]|uniref:alpha/beta fold hydrolase n=1 Tax=Hoeflea sp. TYP-13 TaxID=3230023 RepID=UPI0034C6B329
MTLTLLTILIAIVFPLLVFTWFQTRRIERLYPPSGEFVDVGGYRLHAVHVPASGTPDLPAIVFLHGASGNLLDQAQAFRKKLEGRAELLFVDRPGHGWSERGGAGNAHPGGQAQAIAELMNRKNISSALIVGHSFGGIIAANMALERPEKVNGLLFLSSVSHPWPGGIDWHYHLASNPLIGRIFAWLLVMPAGLLRIEKVARCVFSPNAYPPDYLRDSAAALVLRPHTFRHNACDVANLYAHVVAVSPRYGQIDKPTVVVTGHTDDVVSPDIHSSSLAGAISGAELLRLKGVGHKPDYAATDLCISALEKLSGGNVDLVALAQKLEQQLTMADRPTDASSGKNTNGASSDQIPVMPSDPI